MIILSKPTTKTDILNTATCLMGYDMVKAVADIGRGLIAIDAELHADLEGLLLQDGSKQQDLWGFNLYLTEENPEDFIEFDSLINIRPSQNNRSRDVEDPEVRKKITELVEKWVN